MLVALADDLEEQVGTDLVDGQIAYLIDCQDSWLEVTLEFVFEPPSRLRRRERVVGSPDGIQNGAVLPFHRHIDVPAVDFL